MKTKRLPSSIAPFLITAVILASPLSHATEGGGSTYPSGVENFLVGAAPPPGFYVLEYLNVYSADTLRNSAGDKVAVPGFKVSAKAAATRFVWSTDHQMAGGNLVLHTIVPVVDLKVSAAGASQNKTSVGDITLGAGIAFHHSPALHSVVALDVVAPTGRYKQGDMVNVGRNHWSVEPLYAVSRIDPAGFNWDLKTTLNINLKNKDTQYRSGTELYLDYAAGWGLGNGWTVGVGGHWMRQLTDDKRNGATVDDARTAAFAIGPSLKYDDGKGWFLTAKVTREVSAKNRPTGTALWIKTIIPF